MAEIDERAERRASLVNASVCKGKLLLLWVAALILLISAVCVYFRHGNLMYDYSKGGKTIAFIDIFSSQTGYYMKRFVRSDNRNCIVDFDACYSVRMQRSN